MKNVLFPWEEHVFSLCIMPYRSTTKPATTPKELILSGIVICLLLLGILYSARFGFSKLLTRYALVANNVAAATEAIRITPADADAYRARATVLNRLRLFDQTKNDLAIATALRPEDDYLWLELGLAKDEVGETEGALAALDRAVKLAPYYAHTHWQRGNVLLRLGRYNEAFADLRQAAKANRAFLPSLIDLAWSLSRQDANMTSQLLRIDNSYEQILFTRFLARKGRGPEALNQFRVAPANFSDPMKKDLVRQLMDHHAYVEAFEIWKSFVGAHVEDLPTVYDGGFEGSLAFDEVGFGWSVSRAQAKISMSLDTVERQSGKQSLRIVFGGESNPASPVVSQTLPVESEKRYRVSFAIKSHDVVSGGLPFISVKDAMNNTLLGKSEPIRPGSSEWQTIVFEFAAPKDAQAVLLSLERNPCESSPCPIFGVVWLDGFSISKAD